MIKYIVRFKKLDRDFFESFLLNVVVIMEKLNINLIKINCDSIYLLKMEFLSFFSHFVLFTNTFILQARKL